MDDRFSEHTWDLRYEEDIRNATLLGKLWDSYESNEQKNSPQSEGSRVGRYGKIGSSQTDKLTFADDSSSAPEGEGAPGDDAGALSNTRLGAIYRLAKYLGAAQAHRMNRPESLASEGSLLVGRMLKGGAGGTKEIKSFYLQPNPYL